MQSLVSNLTQFNIFQTSVMIAHLIGFIIVALVAMTLEKTPAFVSAIFAFMICSGAIIASLVYQEEARQEIQNHKYVAVKNGKSLEIESKSDMIKSHKFEIDSEDSKHIYVKVNGLFSSSNVIVDKSEIDEVQN